MSNQDLFFHALKLGKKEYAANKAQGKSGHLPSLEGLIHDVDIVANVNLGVVEIPLKKVIGTYTNSRRVAFAKNFMPVNEGDEFADKWVHVCEAHLNEGIQNPVKVYEYMNWYYVLEGNKRVSVLKYFNVYSIQAEVTRLIPKRDPEDVYIENYYAFLEFSKQTGLLHLWFSKPNRFYRLAEALEAYDPPLDIFKDKYKHFDSYVYTPFRQLYKSAGGDRLAITTGDAFIEFVRLYGIPDTLKEQAVEQAIRHLVEELDAKGRGSAQLITEDLEDSGRPSLLQTLSILLKPVKKLKVGFVHARNSQDSGWTAAHENGRIAVSQVMGEQIETYVIENVIAGEQGYQEILSLIKAGVEVIFTTSNVFRKETLRCALEYPEVLFFNCSESQPYLHMSNYFGRTYEPRFLMGMIAGAVTQNNRIGYLASEETAEAIACINAFSIGVRAVNASAEVFVTYTHGWLNAEKNNRAEQQLLSQKVDTLMNKVLLTADEDWQKKGVYAYLCSIDKDQFRPLSAAYWNWGIYYEKILSNILNNTYKSLIQHQGTESGLINFYWGMSMGVIDFMVLSEHIPQPTLKLVRSIKRLMIQDAYNPFSGELYDIHGNRMCDEGASLTPEEIIHMKWYHENVIVLDQNSNI